MPICTGERRNSELAASQVVASYRTKPSRRSRSARARWCSARRDPWMFEYEKHPYLRYNLSPQCVPRFAAVGQPGRGLLLAASGDVPQRRAKVCTMAAQLLRAAAAGCGRPLPLLSLVGRAVKILSLIPSAQRKDRKELHLGLSDDARRRRGVKGKILGCERREIGA